MKSAQIYIFVFLSTLLFGCAAALVPYTNSPEKKLAYAGDLLDLGRAIPAEKLIQEAIDIYSKQGDQLSLANAYRVYGIFYGHKTYQNYKWLWEKQGNYDSERTKPSEYFLKAIEIFEKNDKYDELSNLEYRLAIEYHIRGLDPVACDSLDSSLNYHRKNKEKYPDREYILPDGCASFDDYIAKARNAFGCNTP